MAAKAKEAEAEAAGAEGEGDAAAGKKKLPLKLIIMAAAGVLVLGGGGFGAYKMMSGGDHKDEKKAEAPKVKPATFFDLPEVLVNLSSAGSDRSQYLKIKIVLELPDQALVESIKPLLPRVMDAFQTYLRELRATDLEGSAGLYRLKEELTRRVNLAIAPSTVTAVLFQVIVVQ